MAARYEEQELRAPECENCGATSALLRCSRCHAAWFCSLKCHKAYWPFHRPSCRPNHFADAVEPSEPRFAAWMRGHGRLAVLRDDEVDRLERASKPGGCWGLSRAEVMDSMYGRADPKPRAPTFDDTERAAMAEAERRDLITRQTALAVRGAVIAAAASDTVPTVPTAASDRHGYHRNGSSIGGGSDEALDKVLPYGVAGAAWEAVQIPEGFGLAVSSRIKWRQTQTHVEVFVRLPEPLAVQLEAGRSIRSKVLVDICPSSLRVEFPGTGDVVLTGQLYAAVCAEDSTWFMDDGMIQIQLLKRRRRGHYAAGTTNADTFWRSLMASAPPSACIPGPHPPAAYYSSAF